MSERRLYQYAVCPFCQKVAACLKLKGIDFEKIEVNPLNKKEIAFSADYKKVPIYVQSGEQINDSTPIMRYIDAQNPGPKIFDDSEQEQRWLEWSDQVVKLLPYLLYSSPRQGWQSLGYIGKESQYPWWQKLYLRSTGALVMWLVYKKKQRKAAIAHPEKELAEKLGQWGEALGDNSFIGGDNPNAADVALFGYLNSIAQLPPFTTVKNTPRVHTWYQTMKEKIS